MNRKLIKISLLVCFALAACGTYKQSELELAKGQPERQIRTYNGSIKNPIEDRIQQAPEVIIDYLHRMDGVDTYKAYELTLEEKRLFLTIFSQLPLQFQEVIEQRVVNIYFIDTFLGGGMTDFLFDEEGTLYLALYINPKVLQTSLTDWIDYRDNSSFLDDDPSQSLVSSCDTSQPALLHTLLHESCHIYDYVYHFTPYVEPIFWDGEEKESTFIKGIWSGYSDPELHFDFSGRKDLKSYGLGKALPEHYAYEMYSKLPNTPFSSIYGSANWAEDFAETFTWFYLFYAYNISYTVTIHKNGEVLLSYKPTDNPLVKERYPLFASLLE